VGWGEVEWGRRCSSSGRRFSSSRSKKVQPSSTKFEEVQRVCRFEPNRCTTPNTTKRFASIEKVWFG
jgi:hypothetical protein